MPIESKFLVLVEKENSKEINVMFDPKATAEELRLIADCIMKQADSKDAKNYIIH